MSGPIRPVTPAVPLDPAFERLRLLTVEEVGAILGLDASTVGKWERAGRLRAIVLSVSGAKRRTLRFQLAEVERFIAAAASAVDPSSEPRARSASASVRSRGWR